VDWCARARCLSPTSATDFCCHEHPLGSQLPSPRLTPPGPSRPARSSCRRRSASSKTEPSSTMSDSRFRYLRPWVVTWLTPRLPAAATSAVLPETLVVFGSRPASAFSAVRKPGEMAPYASCRNPRAIRRTDWRADRQSPFPPLHVNAAAFASSRRLPPTGPAGPRPCFHSNVSLRAATGTPVSPP
jgi:hypothetical protein